jgi:arsenate reductase
LSIDSLAAVPALPRRLLAEFLGSALLAAVVVGSGIAAQQLSRDTGLQLLENAVVTAAGLFAIILIFGPVSGGHFNPVVSLVDAAFGGLSRRDAAAYVPAQVAGCITGAIAANGMFALSAISISSHHRASPAHLFAEVVATLGLVLVIFSLARSGRGGTAPAAVGAYIGAAYWFTSSTSFANPAISVGRIFSDTFAGIAPAAVPAFAVAQLAGGVLAIGLLRVLYPGIGAAAADVVVPHGGSPAGLVRRLVDEVVNRRDASALDEIAGGRLARRAAAWIDPFRSAFPDFRMEVVELIAEHDKVVAHFRCSGTHQGEWLGRAATGRRFEAVDEIYIFEVRDGRLVDAVAVEDNLSRMRQLQLL